MAIALNVFLPGAGLIYLGQRRAGAMLAGPFLVCFLAVMIIFLVGYVRYFSLALDPQILDGNKLEEIGAGFHQGWMIGLAIVGGAIYLVSAILFARAKRQFANAHPGPARGTPMQ